MQITPLSRWLIYLVPPTLFVLNAFWFTKILKGALKLMFGPHRKWQGGSNMAATAAAPAGPSAGRGEEKKER